MAEEWTMPEFLNRDFEEIMEEMTADLPEDIDVSEGSHPYNLLAPTAKQEAYFAQFILAEAMKRIFPQFCEGEPEYVDYHGQVNGMNRKAAAYAEAELSVTGTAEAVIPAGTVFTTASVNDAASVSFVSVEAVTLDENGCGRVTVRAEAPGTGGNVGANTIILQESPIDGISAVTNPEAAKGGTDEESDASFIARIMEYEKMQGLSFVGNTSDYKRWAQEVDGTGTAVVVPPSEDDDSGLVTIVLTDSQGNPAAESLCKKVYDYIVSPDEPERRKAPINGAVLSVVPPAILPVHISATVNLMEGVSLEAVKSAFAEKIRRYLAEVPLEKEIRYTRIGALLSETQGVKDYDYESLLVNDDRSNIAVEVNQFPQIEQDGISLAERR